MVGKLAIIGVILQILVSFLNLPATIHFSWPSQVAQWSRIHLPMQETRDVGSVPGSGRCSGGGNDNPLQYSCLKNSMDREAWRATVHGDAKSWT